MISAIVNRFIRSFDDDKGNGCLDSDEYDVVYWPPYHAVWPNHEVVELQPWSVTTLILGSVSYCYEGIIPVPPVLPYRHYTSLQGRVLFLTCPPTPFVAPLHSIVRPHGCSLSPFQHNNPASSLHGVLHSPENRPSLMTLSCLLISLDVVRYLLIPPTAMPTVLSLHPLPFICKNLADEYVGTFVKTIPSKMAWIDSKNIRYCNLCTKLNVCRGENGGNSSLNLKLIWKNKNN